jgi:hypothetical protein
MVKSHHMRIGGPLFCAEELWGIPAADKPEWDA